MRSLVYWPNPILRAAPRYHRGPLETDLLKDMYVLMKFHKGIGISAVQVGVPASIFIMDNFNEKPIVCINPELFSHSQTGDRHDFLEGCLSLPGIYESVKRYVEIKDVVFYDENAVIQKRTFYGQHAHVYQHEFEHCQGAMFIDRLPPGKKDKIRSILRTTRRKKLIPESEEVMKLCEEADKFFGGSTNE